MNKSAFFLVTLITIALCSGAKVVSYDGIIDKLVELNQAVGKPADEISIVVSKIKSAVEDISKSASSYYDGLKLNCEQGSLLVNAHIKNIENDLLQLKTTKDKAEEDNKRIGDEMQVNAKQLAETKAGLKDIEANIEAKVEEIRVYGVETEQKLAVIKTLRDIITDELLKPEGQGTSFVQLRVFNKKLEELKTLLENSKSTIYNPLIATLVSLTESRGFSDEKILRQILDLLKKLEENLKGFLERQGKEGKEQIKTMKAEAKEKLAQIKNLVQMAANGRSNIQDNLNTISQIEKDTKQMNDHIARKQDELKYWEKICKNEEEVNAKEKEWRDILTQKLTDVSTKVIS